MFRQGKVVEVLCDETRTSVRVQWLDKQGLISFAECLSKGDRIAQQIANMKQGGGKTRGVSKGHILGGDLENGRSELAGNRA
jgi:hypothetical protein